MQKIPTKIHAVLSVIVSGISSQASVFVLDVASTNTNRPRVGNSSP